MTALLLLLAVAAVWAVGIVAYRYTAAPAPDSAGTSPDRAPAEAACGLAGSCALSCAAELPTDTPLYYDDEHLDAFRGRPADAYTPAEVEAFDEVLSTLLPADAHGWLHSLQQRGIELPASLRDAALILVGGA